MSCNGCGRDAHDLKREFQRCARCKIVNYCSRACQESDWPRHKSLCVPVQSLSNQHWQKDSSEQIGGREGTDRCRPIETTFDCRHEWRGTSLTGSGILSSAPCRF
ncbi:hypothetical protein DFJ74DRAFT_691324 [Hyaloraphidium curvatum]|nr:hypothetical protein DFJ74DRAFT_691324 [Hyaloraphidium curvatum]